MEVVTKQRHSDHISVHVSSHLAWANRAKLGMAVVTKQRHWSFQCAHSMSSCTKQSYERWRQWNGHSDHLGVYIPCHRVPAKQSCEWRWQWNTLIIAVCTFHIIVCQWNRHSDHCSVGIWCHLVPVEQSSDLFGAGVWRITKQLMQVARPFV